MEGGERGYGQEGRQKGDKLGQFDQIFHIAEKKKKQRLDKKPRCVARTEPEELNAGL